MRCIHICCELFLTPAEVLRQIRTEIGKFLQGKSLVSIEVLFENVQTALVLNVIERMSRHGANFKYSVVGALSDFVALKTIGQVEFFLLFLRGAHQIMSSIRNRSVFP